MNILRQCGSHFHPKETPEEGKFSEGFLNFVLNGFGSLARHRFSKDSRSSEHWSSLLQSALVSIMDMNKTCKFLYQELYFFILLS